MPNTDASHSSGIGTKASDFEAIGGHFQNAFLALLFVPKQGFSAKPVHLSDPNGP